MQITSSNGFGEEEMKKNIEIILKQLDQWIDDCEKQAAVFQEYKMNTSEISSQAMGQAYWNVKQLIEVMFENRNDDWI